MRALAMFGRRSALAAGLGLLAACSSGPSDSSGEDVGSSSAGVTAADQTAYSFFVAQGLTSYQAAGIVGNLDQESGMDPTIAQYGGGPGRGIAQWSAGGRWDTDAGDNVVWYAGTKGESATSLQLQLQFIWYELTTFSGYGLSELRQSTNVTDATIAFETYYEGCGQCDQSTRISYAEAALSAFGSQPPPAPPAYAAEFVSQSFPLASTAFTIVAGQTVPADIEMKNTGAKAWDSSTHVGTTQPRDRTSVFADSTWLAPNRPAGVTGSVAPGATYSFAFNLHAPTTAGTYLEYFNLVQEGVAWFSDPGQGGPPDNDLEANLVVVTPLFTPEAGIKRHVTDPTSLADWKLTTVAVAHASNTGVAAYPTGAPLPGSPTVVVATGAPAVWVIDGSVRRHVVSPASLTAWGFTVATWTASQVDAVPQGADWPTVPFVLEGVGDPAIYVLDVPPEAGKPDAGSTDADAGSSDGSAPGEVLDASTAPLTPSPADDAGAKSHIPTSADSPTETGPSGSAAGCSTTPRSGGGDTGWLLLTGLVGGLYRGRKRDRSAD
jgi:hypothetical protein